MLLNEMLLSKGQIVEGDQSKLPKGVVCRGIWLACNIGQKNQNNRVYEKAVFEKVMNDPVIKQKMETRTLFGQGEHPEKTQSDLLLTSHLITAMHIKEDGVYQTIDILDTPAGRIINTLIEAGCQVGVSTRAEGDLEEKEEKGKKYFRVIPESYHYVTTDFTADPSTYGTIPMNLEKRLVTEVMDGVHSKEVKDRIPKLVAVSILEKMHGKDAVAAIKKIGEEKECKDNKGCACGGCGKCDENKDKDKVDEAKQTLIETSARVGVVKPDGTVQSVLIKWDGYPEGVGTTLESFYSDERKLEQLLSLGNVSALGKEIGEKHNFEERPKGQTTFYGRDRGDKDAVSKSSQNESEFRGLAKQEGSSYAYLFSEGKWRTMVLKEAVKEVKKSSPTSFVCDGCKKELPLFRLSLSKGSKNYCSSCKGEVEKKTEEPADVEKIPETFEQVFNWDMAQLGLGVMIKEGKYKGPAGTIELKNKKRGRITTMTEGHVVITAEDGMIIHVDNPTSLSIEKEKGPPSEDLVHQEEEEPEHKDQTPGEVAAEEEVETPEEEEVEHALESKVEEGKMGVDYVRSLQGAVKRAKAALKAKNYEEAAKELGEVADDASDAAKAAKKMKREAEQKAAVAKDKSEQEAEKEEKGKKDTKEAIVTESFDDMVKYIEGKLSGASTNEVARFGDLVKTKILNERVTPSTTAKEIRQLKIAEASVRAERDKAIELIDELESGGSSVLEQKELEQKILIEKLNVSKGMIRIKTEASAEKDKEVAALCSKIEEKQEKLNEMVQTKEKEIQDLKQKHESMLAEQKKTLEEQLQKKQVKEYTELKLTQSGLKVSQNARALLEKCSTIESVNETFEELKDAMRKDALRPNDIKKVQIKESETKEVSKVKDQVQSIMGAMR